MRWPWLVWIALAAARAEADPGTDASAAPRAAGRGDLWREMIDPKGDEVRTLLAKAQLAMRRADDALSGDADWAVEPRVRFYRDAYRLAAYARTLAPENLDALATFARAAGELGETREALEALELSAKLTGADRAALDVTGPLGEIYLRLGDADRAVRWLRLAQGPASVLGLSIEQAHALVHLATALALRGETVSAIQTLANALPDRALGHYTNEQTVIAFALAVLYDRDEQRAAAFEVLDHMQTTLSAQYQTQVQRELSRLPFAPPEDLHYYRALLYESQGHYVEARAEWMLYAAAGQPRFAGRALDHVAAIDAQRRARPGSKPSTSPAPPSAIPRKLSLP